MKPLSSEAQRLQLFYQRLLYGGLVLAWIGIGLPSLWGLRLEIRRMLEYFTWASLKYSLFYKPQWPSLGLLFCLGFSFYVLLSLFRYEVIGLMRSERDLLESQVEWIRRLSPKHPLRRLVIGLTPSLPSGSEPTELK